MDQHKQTISLSLPEKSNFSSTPLRANLSYEEREGRPAPDGELEPYGSLAETQDSYMAQDSSMILSEAPSTRRSKLSNRSNTLEGPSRVVFSTPAKYDRWIWVILAIPLLLVLFQLVVVLVATSKAAFQRSQTAWVLGWTMILIFGVYMMVLPKQVDVRSNGAIGIKTFLVTYHFGDVCRAYIAGEGREDFVRPRYKFATCLEPPHRIVIRRRGGKWDVVVSPSEPEDFLRALESVIQQVEEQRQPSLTKDTEMGSFSLENEMKPDLSAV